MQRLVFSGGARFGFAKTGGGAWLALRAKIGSSVGVKLYQKCTFSEIVARERRFFFGCAERRPNVFRGEKQFGQPLAAPFWFLAAIGGFCLVQ
jgi:hypothetical protein